MSAHRIQRHLRRVALARSGVGGRLDTNGNNSYYDDNNNPIFIDFCIPDVVNVNFTSTFLESMINALATLQSVHRGQGQGQRANGTVGDRKRRSGRVSASTLGRYDASSQGQGQEQEQEEQRALVTVRNDTGMQLGYSASSGHGDESMHPTPRGTGGAGGGVVKDLSQIHIVPSGSEAPMVGLTDQRESRSAFDLNRSVTLVLIGGMEGQGQGLRPSAGGEVSVLFHAGRCFH